MRRRDVELAGTAFGWSAAAIAIAFAAVGVLIAAGAQPSAMRQVIVAMVAILLLGAAVLLGFGIARRDDAWRAVKDEWPW